MEIIPAIDIIDGKCVRLTQGDFNRQTTYHENPVEVALEFEAAGIRRLHLVDLDGAKSGEIKNLEVLKKIAAITSLEIDFGGGVKSIHAVETVLNAGAEFVTVGSIGIKDPAMLKEWIKNFGAEKFLLGADVIGRKIAIHGWTETSDTDLFDFIESFMEAGIRQIFCTDVSRDGQLQGPATDLYTGIVKRFPELYFIASGGVSSMADLEDLKISGCSAAIVGKAIYEGKISLDQLSTWSQKDVMNKKF